MYLKVKVFTNKIYKKGGSIMKVICTRNNAEFEFVRMEDEDYVLADPETGKEKIINGKSI